ncbi:hypothetical protein FRC12_005535 [Ceratobasidium sp. 428]|nr:hypothetical protein FRC12_005535 [Ceratobasidium sp. 428]
MILTQHAQVASAESAELRPGPSSDPQNINGSEHLGRKTREEFVTKTINSAVNGHPTGAGRNAAPQETDHAPSTGVIQDNAPSQPSASTQESGPVATNEAATSKSAKGKSKAQNPPAPAPAPTPTPEILPDDDDVDMADESLDESEGEEVRQLKELYKSRPTRAMKDAFRSMLDELSDDAEAEQNPGRPKRKRQAPRPGSNWEEDDKFVCTDGPRRRDKRRVALSVCSYILVYVVTLATTPHFFPSRGSFLSSLLNRCDDVK